MNDETLVDDSDLSQALIYCLKAADIHVHDDIKQCITDDFVTKLRQWIKQKIWKSATPTTGACSACEYYRDTAFSAVCDFCKCRVSPEHTCDYFSVRKPKEAKSK